MMRRRGMGLVGAMATTAVVAGTAGAVRHHQDQKYANQAAQQQAQADAQQQAAQSQQDVAALQQQMADMQAQQAATAVAPAAAAPAPAAGTDLTSQLNQLAQMKASGVLTDAEFEAAKAKLLAG